MSAVGSCRRTVGFTLLEVLLVVTIVGILASVIVLGATDVGRQRTIRAEAERMALAIELARDEARLRNAVWGLSVEGGAYRFMEYEETKREWHPVERREFDTDATDEGIAFTVGPGFGGSGDLPEALPWNPESGGGGPTRMASVHGDDEARPPDVVIYPGGEMTPFKITASGGPNYAAWVAQSDGIQRTRAIVENEVAEVDDDLQQWLDQAGFAP